MSQNTREGRKALCQVEPGLFARTCPLGAPSLPLTPLWTVRGNHEAWGST